MVLFVRARIHPRDEIITNIATVMRIVEKKETTINFRNDVPLTSFGSLHANEKTRFEYRVASLSFRAFYASYVHKSTRRCVNELEVERLTFVRTTSALTNRKKSVIRAPGLLYTTRIKDAN